MAKSVRIGVMCNHLLWEEWEICVVESLLQIQGVSLVVVVHPADTEHSTLPFFKKILKYPYRKLLWNRARGFWFRHPFFKRVDFRSRLGDVPMMGVVVQRNSRNRERIDSKGIAQIADYKPDLILRFGFNILEGEILQLPSMGVWSFHHADPHQIRGGPLGFWEIFHGYRSSAVVLQRLNEKLDQGEVLAYRRFTTSLHSYQEHVARLIENSIEMPAQVLKSLISGLWSAPLFEPLPHQNSRLFRIPGNFLVIGFFIRLFLRRLQFYFKKYFRQEHWTVFYYDSLKCETKEIYNNSEGYLADPFFYFNREGVLHIMAEKYKYSVGKGGIVMINTLNGQIRERLFGAVNHQAYPFVIHAYSQDYILADDSVNGKVYLRPIPNSLSNSYQWIEILDFPGVDPTLIYFNGRWWLWCTRAGMEADAELHLFYSDHFEGPYLPHAGNPVKFDCANARPAGRPISVGGKLFRPAQNCSLTYGGDVVWNSVELIEPDQYFERPCTPPFEVPVKGRAEGMHHVDFYQNSYVYDIKSYRFSFASFVKHINDRFV